MDDLGPVVTAGNPVPPGGSFAWLERGQGIRLRYGLWRTAAAKNNGTVVVIPGRTEFIEKYFEVVAELLRRAYHVAVLDLRGQGLSSRQVANPKFGHVSDFADYEADLDAWLTDVVQPELSAPFIGLAHSMGANILLRYLCNHADVFARAIMTSPLTGIKLHWLSGIWAERIASLGCRLFGPTVAMASGPRADPLTRKFEHNALTYDRSRFERQIALIAAEPRLALGPPTWGWLVAAFMSLRYVNDRDRMAQVLTPILLVSASDDRIVDNHTHAKFATSLSHSQLITVNKSQHEILMETDAVRCEFWAAFDRFVAGA